jgi:hypothetical protein
MTVKSMREMQIGVRDPSSRVAVQHALSEPPVNKSLHDKIADPPIREFKNNESAKEETTLVDETGKILNSDYIRVDLISNFIFYDWSDISVRPFKPRDQAKLATAVKHKNMSIMLDVMSACATRDMRELVFSDWRSLCILHKRYSYLDTPYRITWNSRYGKVTTASTKEINLEEERIKFSRKEYLEWKKEYGLAVPTTRDIELITNDMDEETIYLFDRAQYIDPEPLKERIEELRLKGDRKPSLTARIEKLDDMGLAAFAQIEKFDSLFNAFGIKERAVVQIEEKEFDPLLAITALQNFTSNEEDSIKAKLEVEKALKEAEQIEALYNAAKETTSEDQPVKIKYVPQTEEVPLAFSPWTMFPYT